MGFSLRWFGILLGAVSLFSLAQKLYDFGLAPIFKDMLAHYRATFYPMADAILAGLGWAAGLIHKPLPAIPQDAVIIYVLLGLALAGMAAPKLVRSGGGPLFIVESIVFVLTLAIFGPPLLLLALLTSTFTAGRDTLAHWLAEAGKVAMLFLVMFGTNGMLLSA